MQIREAGSDGLATDSAAVQPSFRTWTSMGAAATSFLFAVLQSVCTLFFALGAIRVMIGATALIAVGQFGLILDRIHADHIRLPMLALTTTGLIMSWASLRRIRRIRENPSSQWRRKPLSARQARWERWQWVSQLATVALLLIEEGLHFRHFHHF